MMFLYHGRSVLTAAHDFFILPYILDSVGGEDEFRCTSDQKI
jgi:hypothetical protein